MVAAFAHATAKRQVTDNVVLEVETVDGAHGYGEAIPRLYLTGESIEDVLASVRRTLLERAPRGDTFEEVVESVQSLSRSVQGNAGRAGMCALELALLDAAGHTFARPFGDALGPRRRELPMYTGCLDSTIDFVEPPYELALAPVRRLMERHGFEHVKAKVGQADDDARLDALRPFLPADVEWRVDANACWDADTAVARARSLGARGIRVIEQPVAANDHVGMRRVREESGSVVIADESLCSLEDAYRLVAASACDIVNVRLAKCGGALEALRIAEYARSAGLRVQLSGLVGELGLLEAAASHALLRLGDELVYCDGGSQRDRFEGGFDIVEEDLRLDAPCTRTIAQKSGLGVTTLRSHLARYATAHHAFDLTVGAP